MIPVQKSFPPSLLRRWRKVMRETPKLKYDGRWDDLHDYAVRCQQRENYLQRREYSADWILEQLADPAKAAKLKDAGWDLKSLQSHAETVNHMRSHLAFKKWKLSQDRAKWVYTVIAGILLVLIIWLVSRG